MMLPAASSVIRPSPFVGVVDELVLCHLGGIELLQFSHQCWRVAHQAVERDPSGKRKLELLDGSNLLLRHSVLLAS